MKYKCIPCGDEFEFEGGEKPRCPKCLGIHDLEKVSENKETKKSRQGWIAPTIVLALAAAIGVFYFTMSGKAPDSGDGISEKDIEKAVDLANLDLPGELSTIPFAVTDNIESFAQATTDGKSGEAALEALLGAIQKKKSDGAWKPHHQREPRPGKVLTANELLKRFENKGEVPLTSTSYELASLMLALARSIKIDAQMVEITQYTDDKAPSDAGGKLGTFGVAMKKPGKIFDPYTGRISPADKVENISLVDREAVAPFYSLQALSLLAEQNTAEALKLNEAAVELAPNNPYPRAGRGLIFAASGAPGEAVAEFEKAVKLRDDSVFRTNLAELFLLVDPTGRRSEVEIQAALQKTPNYARAHALLAMVLMMQRQVNQAEQELGIASNLDPSSPTIAMFWAQLYLGKGDSERAIEKAMESVRLSEGSITSMLGLAQIYKATARFDEMRTTLDQVLEKTESPMIATQIKELFDYDPTGGEPESPTPTGSQYQLKLGKGGSGGLQLGEGMGSGLKLNNGLSGGELELKLDLNNTE